MKALLRFKLLICAVICAVALIVLGFFHRPLLTLGVLRFTERVAKREHEAL